MSKISDHIPTKEELDQEFPYMHIVGGRKPPIQLTNSKLRRAVVMAEKRAADTGLDIRVTDARGKAIYQADAE